MFWVMKVVKKTKKSQNPALSTEHRIHRLYPLQGGKSPRLDKRASGMTLNYTQLFWSSGESGVLYECYYFQVHSDPDW